MVYVLQVNSLFLGVIEKRYTSIAEAKALANNFGSWSITILSEGKFVARISRLIK